MRRLFILFVVLIVVGVSIAAVGLYLARPAGTTLGAPQVLTLRIAGDLPEHNLAADLPIPGATSEPDLADFYLALRAARDDRSVRGVAVRIDDVHFGLAKAAELRRQFGALREAGKFVACYLDTAGDGSNGTLEYFVASSCDSIRLSPSGEVNLIGLFADSLFLRGLFDKLKLEPSFLAIGTYKSAAEVFTQKQHSPAAREALAAVLDGFFADVVDGIADGRKLDAATVRQLVEKAPLSAEDALAAKLVDALAYPEEFDEFVKAQAGGDPRLVDLEEYARANTAIDGGDRIAVLVAAGTIVRGEGGVSPWSGESFIGDRDLHRTIDELAEDDGVRAVVLRIDSPGGSALASSLILHDLERLDAKKPVVVSMSDLAASGGYYIAAKARRIVAEPGTLTGSIGVVGGKIATGRFEQDLLGATHDSLQRGANAGIYSTLHPFSDSERAHLEREMQHVYDTFVGVVATGRHLERSAVESVAQGRVWTGADALRNHLVDELGGLDRAVDLARELAGLSRKAHLRIGVYPKPPSFWAWLAARKSPRFALNAELRLLLSAMRPRAELELPPELSALARPF